MHTICKYIIIYIYNNIYIFLFNPNPLKIFFFSSSWINCQSLIPYASSYGGASFPGCPTLAREAPGSVAGTRVGRLLAGCRAVR